MPKPRKSLIEIYNIDRSPLSFKPTQKDIAQLLDLSRDDLRSFVNYKEQFIRRRTININGKLRDLAYPVGPLRILHEKLKFHLNKIILPNYLFSPRKGKKQRDNASYHIEQCQYLMLDLKQFYPSTSFSMVKNWCIEEFRMYEDVAGLLSHLATVDGKVSFGSPLTPVLTTLVHRRMYNEIANLCYSRGLRFSVWVDDVTISGKFIPGKLLKQIRDIIKAHGMRSHRISYQHGNRVVFITGIGVVGKKLVAPNKLHTRIKDLCQEFHITKTQNERDNIFQRLSSQMGTLRHIVGSKSEAGQKVSNQMNSIKQKRNKYRLKELELHNIQCAEQKKIMILDELPW